MKNIKEIPSFTLPYSPIGQVGEPLYPMGIFIMEVWKDVKGFEGLYQVSNLGRVKSKKTDLIRKLTLSNNGYLVVSLYKKPIGGRVFTIHKLVSLMFLGESKGLDVNHKDGNKKNNELSNLELCTRSQNMYHAYRNSLMKMKISMEIKEEIRNTPYYKGMFVGLAKKYSVRHSTISRIYNGKTS